MSRYNQLYKVYNKLKETCEDCVISLYDIWDDDPNRCGAAPPEVDDKKIEAIQDKLRTAAKIRIPASFCPVCKSAVIEDDHCINCKNNFCDIGVSVFFIVLYIAFLLLAAKIV